MKRRQLSNKSGHIVIVRALAEILHNPEFVCTADMVAFRSHVGGGCCEDGLGLIMLD